MFMPHLPDSFSAADIQKYAPAGYVLYAKDFSGKTKEEVQQMIARYQQASKIPLLISADEEGGSVVRISSNPALRDTPFLSPQNVYQNSGLTGLIRDTQEKSRLLLSLGVNLNLAPVCDFTTDKSSYIYKRTLGLSAEKTAEGIAAIVRTMEQEGISGALKHFPGYGSSTDTHAGIAYDHRDKSEFIRQDFLPFIAGIEQGVPSILISHNIVTCMDSDYPASLSKEVHRVLREELHFDGVIMTDDLSMGAIKQFASGSSPAVMAVLAGNDLLLTADWKKEYANVLSAVNSGVIPVSRVNDAVERILNWKIDKGLLSAG
ncbi:MAG: beta-hexosaminidase [Clostridiales bacterium]|nr:beta-hexosaminidase [Clostridiales bacterium]